MERERGGAEDSPVKKQKKYNVGPGTKIKIRHSCRTCDLKFSPNEIKHHRSICKSITSASVTPVSSAAAVISSSQVEPVVGNQQFIDVMNFVVKDANPTGDTGIPVSSSAQFQARDRGDESALDCGADKMAKTMQDPASLPSALSDKTPAKKCGIPAVMRRSFQSHLSMCSKCRLEMIPHAPAGPSERGVESESAIKKDGPPTHSPALVSSSGTEPVIKDGHSCNKCGIMLSRDQLNDHFLFCVIHYRTKNTNSIAGTVISGLSSPAPEVKVNDTSVQVQDKDSEKEFEEFVASLPSAPPKKMSATKCIFPEWLRKRFQLHLPKCGLDHSDVVPPQNNVPVGPWERGGESKSTAVGDTIKGDGPRTELAPALVSSLSPAPIAKTSETSAQRHTENPPNGIAGDGDDSLTVIAKDAKGQVQIDCKLNDHPSKDVLDSIVQSIEEYKQLGVSVAKEVKFVGVELQKFGGVLENFSHRFEKLEGLMKEALGQRT